MARNLIICLALLLSLTSTAVAQVAPYRYSTFTKTPGSSFYAIDGSTGQLYFMNDYGDGAGEWNHYGLVLRHSGRNNLQFRAVPVDDGASFYALEGASGQLYYMHDHGDDPGRWKPYGLPILNSGQDFLQFEVEQMQEGCKFTAMDGNTGQMYFMYDFGDNNGKWLPYGGTLK